MTSEELLRWPDDGFRHELVRGRLRSRPFAGAEAGCVGASLITALGDTNGAGAVYAAAGFQIDHDPDTVRAPTAAFVQADRIIHTDDFFDGPPDAAFEVISFGDTYNEIEEKTRDWLRAGVRAVIIIDPETRTARVHRSTGAVAVTDVIEIDDVIPGWRLPLASLFD